MLKCTNFYSDTKTHLKGPFLLKSGEEVNEIKTKRNFRVTYENTTYSFRSKAIVLKCKWSQNAIDSLTLISATNSGVNTQMKKAEAYGRCAGISIGLHVNSAPPFRPRSVHTINVYEI